MYKRLMLMVLLGLVACEVPVAPKHDNRYDPAYEEADQRIPNTPGAMRLADSDLQSLTFSWEDRSSFDAGVVVTRESDLSNIGGSGVPVAFRRTPVFMPAPAETFTDRPPIVQSFTYRFFASTTGSVRHNGYGESNILGMAVSFPRRLVGTPGSAEVTRLVYSPDESLLALVNQRRIEVWEVDSGQRLYTHTLLPEGASYGSHRINDLAFSPDGAVLAVGSTEGLHLCDARSGASLRTLPYADEPEDARHVMRIAFSPDGALLAATSLAAVQVWNAAAEQVVTTLERAFPVEGPWGEDLMNGPITAAFAPDGRSLVTVTRTGATFWDRSTWSPATTISWGKAEEWALSAAVSPTANRLAVTRVNLAEGVSWSQTRYLIDLSGGTVRAVLEEGYSNETDGSSRKWIRDLDDAVREHMVFSGDGSTLVLRRPGPYILFQHGDMMFVYETDQGSLVTRFREVGWSMSAAALSYDGRYMVTGYSPRFEESPVFGVWDLEDTWQVDSTWVRLRHADDTE